MAGLPDTAVGSMDGSTKSADAVPVADAIEAATNIFNIGNLDAATCYQSQQLC